MEIIWNIKFVSLSTHLSYSFSSMLNPLHNICIKNLNDQIVYDTKNSKRYDIESIIWGKISIDFIKRKKRLYV